MHHHFTTSERETLYRLLCHEKRSVRQIAVVLGKSHSSVSREIRRNQNNYLGYLPDRAHALASGRRKAAYLLWWEKDPELLAYMLTKLAQGWSPELISISRRRAGQTSVCHESMYALIYSSQGKAQGWHRLLRHSRTRRKKRTGRRAKRTLIPGRVGIEARPEEANDRSQIGHWEADSVLFSKQRACISVALERSSRYVLLTKLSAKTAAETTLALARLSRYPCYTLTVDNGPEFTKHQQLPMPVYFCVPYHSWEKGSVEQVNGLLRQYLPRTTNLSEVSQGQLEHIAHLLNTRPRKCLNYRTPEEELQASGAFQS
jgi:transposase, IS30 family